MKMTQTVETPNDGGRRNVELCDFCCEFPLPADADTTQGRIVQLTARLVAFPTLGALAPGHLLLAPVQHHLSFGAFQSADDWAVVYAARDDLQATYGQVTAFEHGSSAAGSRGGCGITHAHLHLVPTGRELPPPELPDGQWKRIAPGRVVDDLAHLANVGLDYLYFSPSAEVHYVATVHNVQSQFCRRYLASQLRLPFWDWRMSVLPADRTVVEWLDSWSAVETSGRAVACHSQP